SSPWLASLAPRMPCLRYTANSFRAGSRRQIERRPVGRLGPTGYAEPGISAVIAADASAFRGCLIKSVMAAQVSSGLIRICATNAIIITAMLKYGIGVLFTNTL